MSAELSRLQSPAAVQAALDEFVRLGRTAFLARYGFGKSRDFMVRDAKTGQLCDSKAIIGAAFGHQFPEEGPLKAADFSGGEATVVPKLQRLGFEVVRIGEDWSAAEVQATVTSYFEMLHRGDRGPGMAPASARSRSVADSQGAHPRRDPPNASKQAWLREAHERPRPGVQPRERDLSVAGGRHAATAWCLRHREGVVRSQARKSRENELGSAKPSSNAIATSSSVVLDSKRLAVVLRTPSSSSWKLVPHSPRRR